MPSRRNSADALVDALAWWRSPRRRHPSGPRAGRWRSRCLSGLPAPVTRAVCPLRSNELRRSWDRTGIIGPGSCSIASANNSVCRSTSAATWLDDIRAMLWNGVISTPWLSMKRWNQCSRSGSMAAAAWAPLRGGSQNQYSPRQPRRCTVQGRPRLAITEATPSVQRSARGMAMSKSRSRSALAEGHSDGGDRQSVAGQSAADAAHIDAFAVEERPRASRRSPRSCRTRPPGCRPRWVCPMVSMSGCRPQAAVAPPGPGADGVGLVDHQHGAGARADLAAERRGSRDRAGRCRCW